MQLKTLLARKQPQSPPFFLLWEEIFSPCLKLLFAFVIRPLPSALRFRRALLFPSLPARLLIKFRSPSAHRGRRGSKVRVLVGRYVFSDRCLGPPNTVLPVRINGFLEEQVRLPRERDLGQLSLDFHLLAVDDPNFSGFPESPLEYPDPAASFSVHMNDPSVQWVRIEHRSRVFRIREVAVA
jgi:hypothetical protein